MRRKKEKEIIPLERRRRRTAALPVAKAKECMMLGACSGNLVSCFRFYDDDLLKTLCLPVSEHFFSSSTCLFSLRHLMMLILSIAFVGYWPNDEVTLRALLVMMLQGLCFDFWLLEYLPVCFFSSSSVCL